MVIIRGVITCEPGRNNNTLVERLRAPHHCCFPQHVLRRSVPEGGGGSLRGKKICLLDIVDVRVVVHWGLEADILDYGLW